MVPRPDEVAEYILINYRWVFVCFVLLPLSFLFDIWLYFRNWIVFKLTSAPKQHAAKVKHVQSQVKEWAKSGKKTLMCTARPGWQNVSFRRGKYKDVLYKIEVNLVDILEVDVEKQVLRVEPMVTMGQLSATINPLGWTIPVVPEIDDLTVGGLVMGTGIESTSHKYGLFQHICLGYEMVLSDGSVITCSRESNPDLFYATPWSYGTLGILTAIDIKMVPAKPYVCLTYNPISGFDKLVSEFQRVSDDPNNDFVEGIMYSLNEGVIMTGNFADKPEHDKINAIGKWYKPWFFMHVKETLQNKTSVTEYIPLRDYYHRHTRSIFWELQDIIPFGNNVKFRYLLGWMVPPKISLLKLTQTDATKRLYDRHHVIQDLLVPIKDMKKCVEACHNEFGVYPLWLCPFTLPPNPGMLRPGRRDAEMYVDIGVYGVPTVEKYLAYTSLRTIEELVIECDGFQMLYADTYTTREEFRLMFDHALYDRMRIKLNCDDAFPEVFDKVSRDARD